MEFNSGFKGLVYHHTLKCKQKQFCLLD